MNLRDLERESIRRFVQRAADDGYLSGRVLDYGCGRQPYRDIVEAAGGEYHGYDRISYPANVSGENIGDDDLVLWPEEPHDAVLMTQVVQYIPFARYDGQSAYLPHLFSKMIGEEWLRHQGHLVLTYPTNWPEVEPQDLHRFTKAGMERLLTEAGFTIVRHEKRATLYDPQFEYGSGKRLRATGEEFVIGYGAVARA